MKPLDYIDNFLNSFTMYRLVVYGLLLLVVIAGFMSATGGLALSPGGLGRSLVILLLVSYVSNRVLARIWHAVPNQESWLITALILFFILPPVTTLAEALSVAATGMLAIATKYIFALHNKHVFNPAAAAAAAGAFLGFVHATWWVGSNSLWPAVLVVGLLIVRKVRRFTLFITFVAAALLTTIIQALSQHQFSLAFMQSVVLASPLIFLGTIMLTEPATMPVKKVHQIMFAVGVGFLYASHLHLPNLYVYPETALAIGNVFAYLVTPKYNFHLRLARVEMLSERIYNYVFHSDHPLNFTPGQYMEWTLPNVPYDARGNRRTFTIASSPTEDEVMMTVKFYEPASSYKQTLYNLARGARMTAGQTAGNFTLPPDPQQKLLFVAGGVGITPFRSMLKYLIDNGQQRDIVMFYLVNDPSELVFKDVLRAAADIGVRVIPIASQAPEDWNGVTGRLTAELLQHYVNDLAERTVYVSGPDAMVTAIQRVAQAAGVRRQSIVTDHFSGY